MTEAVCEHCGDAHDPDILCAGGDPGYGIRWQAHTGNGKTGDLPTAYIGGSVEETLASCQGSSAGTRARGATTLRR